MGIAGKARHAGEFGRVGKKLALLAGALEDLPRGIVRRRGETTRVGNSSRGKGSNSEEQSRKKVESKTPEPELRPAVDDASNKILSQSKIDEMLATPKGSRPNPSEYLSSDYIKTHLSQFDEGAARIISKKAMEKFGTAGPSPSLVMPKPYVEKIIKEGSGDIGKIEDALGFPKGSLDPEDIMIAEIPLTNDIKIPSGNEGGANPLWEPGGFNSGGFPEAVVDLPATRNLTFKPLI